VQNWRVSGLHDDDEDRDLTRFLPSFNHPGKRAATRGRVDLGWPGEGGYLSHDV
jgi:hypothetical protein